MPRSSGQLTSRRKFTAFFTPLRIEPLEERALLTLTAQVIKDINTVPAGISPSGPVVEMGGVGYFVGNTAPDTAPSGGPPGALWRTDGTAAGTRMVKDILVKAPDTVNTGDTASLVNVNGTLYFAARQPGTGYELWKSDGTTAGTTLVKDFGTPPTPFSPIRHLTNVNGRLFFVTNDGTNGYELWKSDGTAASTILVKDIWQGPQPHGAGYGQPGPSSLTNFNGTLFFSANDGTNGYELWKSDGTANGTALFKSIATGSASSSPSKLASFQGNLFFVANDGTNGSELWKSDGTTNGTALLKDINTGADSSYARSFTEANGKLFFLASDTVSSVALWKTDGTANGTIVLKDFSPDRSYGQYGNAPRGLANVNGTLFFSADDGLGGFGQVFRSDGTVNGTTLVKRFNPGTVDGDVTTIGSFNGTFFFRAYDYSGNEGDELWKSDGTAAGTTLVKDITPGSDNSDPSYFSAGGGILYFSARDTDFNLQLWRTDGTTNGTTPVSRAPITASSSQYAFNSAATPVLGGFEYFAANDGNAGDELWRTDGTNAGTTLVTDLNPGGASSHPASITAFNGKLFFTADNGFGNQLWMSDGTANGTSFLFNPANPFYDPRDLATVGTSLYFTARDSTFTRGLWKTDGTIAGTVLVSNSPQFGYLPPTLTNVNGTLYFSASDATNGIELWKSDGTTNGTGPVKDIYPGPFGSFPEFLTNFNGTLFFFAGDQSAFQLYKSNGTASGTTPVTGVLPGPAVGLVNVGGTLYFSANDGINGYELWRSNGTQAGTSFVKDINPGSASSYIANLTNANGTLYFNANDGTHGVELWRSNGTAAGTVQVADIAPGSASSQPDRITFVNSRVIFVADDGLHSREPMTMLDVNAAPSFTKGADQSVTDESGPQPPAAWATGISVGPADESTQTAAFSVLSNTNPGLFAVPPTIDATGKLSFTAKPNVAGSAQITIVLKDSGGTANGGNDTSATQTFTINVTKPHLWYNAAKPLDVNNDNHVFPNDALAIINYLNAFGHGDVSGNAQIGQPWGFIDPDHDNHINPTDALKVINVINAGQGGEGEANSASSNLDQLIDLITSDPQSGTSRRPSLRVLPL